jgi:hypothetical protein
MEHFVVELRGTDMLEVQARVQVAVPESSV